MFCFFAGCRAFFDNGFWKHGIEGVYRKVCWVLEKTSVVFGTTFLCGTVFSTLLFISPEKVMEVILTSLPHSLRWTQFQFKQFKSKLVCFNNHYPTMWFITSSCDKAKQVKRWFRWLGFMVMFCIWYKNKSLVGSLGGKTWHILLLLQMSADITKVQTHFVFILAALNIMSPPPHTYITTYPHPFHLHFQAFHAHRLTPLAHINWVQIQSQ